MHMSQQAATEMLAEVVSPEVRGDSVRIVFPSVLDQTAQALAAALESVGVTVSRTLTPEASFSSLPPEEAAEGWVPSPKEGLPPTLILFGAQPWEQSFSDDHLIELAAMTNREQLIAKGHYLVFVDWPRGARLDAEVDLRADDMARIFSSAMSGVYESIRHWNHRLIDEVNGSRDVRLECPAGSSLRLSVAGRKWISEDCQLGSDEPAVYLPGGEIYVPAVETSGEGRVVFYYCGELRIAEFEAGILVAVEHANGSADVDRGEEMGVGSEPLCEFGIGTNPWAPPWQIGTIYEKSAGTVHVAVGGNAHFGGLRDSPRHADLVIREPSVWIDGRALELPPPLWMGFDTGKQRG